MGQRTLFCLALGAWLATGCEGDIDPDGGGTDAGSAGDASAFDAGPPISDADTLVPDAGGSDAGPARRGWQRGYNLTGTGFLTDVTELASGDLVAVGVVSAFGEGASDACSSAPPPTGPTAGRARSAATTPISSAG